MSIGKPNDQTLRRGANSAARDDLPPGAEWEAAKEEVAQAAEAAVGASKHFADAVAQEATGYANRRKDTVASLVEDLALSLRESCRSFEDRPNIKAFADTAADGIEDLGARIRAQSFTDLFDEVQTAVRRHPMAVAGATFFAGFVLSRFIKSSGDSIRQAEFERHRAEGPRRGQPVAASARAQV